MGEGAFIRSILSMEDPRKDRGKRYPLKDIIVMAVFGMLSGFDNAVDIADYCDERKGYFLDSFGIKGVPSHDTFSRVMAMLDFRELAGSLSSFLGECFPAKYAEYGGKRVLRVDGKALRGGTAKSEGEKPVYLMNAMYEGGTISLYSERVGDKTNEIKAIPKFLRSFELSNCIVTIDAIGLQKEIIDEIESKGGDWLIVVKENQKRLHRAIEAEIARLEGEGAFAECPTAEALQKCHGRIEKRTARLLTDTAFIAKDMEALKGFMGIGSILVIDKTVEQKVDGIWEKTETRAYAASSLSSVSASDMMQIKLGHWGIEKSHWLLDVQFSEDRCTARKGNSGQNLSTIRRFAIAVKEAIQGDDRTTTKRFFIRNLVNPKAMEEALFTM